MYLNYSNTIIFFLLFSSCMFGRLFFVSQEGLNRHLWALPLEVVENYPLLFNPWLGLQGSVIYVSVKINPLCLVHIHFFLLYYMIQIPWLCKVSFQYYKEISKHNNWKIWNNFITVMIKLLLWIILIYHSWDEEYSTK